MGYLAQHSLADI